jgi:tetratricopeptide (TPR) repeat protein
MNRSQNNVENAFYYKDRCNVLFDLGRLQEAENAYRKAVGVDPMFADGLYGLACLLEKIGQAVPRPKSPTKKAISLNLGHGGAHFNLGNVLYDLGRLDEAENAYRKMWSPLGRTKGYEITVSHNRSEAK